MDLKKKSNPQTLPTRHLSDHQAVSNRYLSSRLRRLFSFNDKKYAVKNLGNCSVYCFFVGDSVLSWLIALITIGVQFWLVSKSLSFHDYVLGI